MCPREAVFLKHLLHFLKGLTYHHAGAVNKIKHRIIVVGGTVYYVVNIHHINLVGGGKHDTPVGAVLPHHLPHLLDCIHKIIYINRFQKIIHH